jgi:hypothetical protein
LKTRVNALTALHRVRDTPIYALGEQPMPSPA